MLLTPDPVATGFVVRDGQRIAWQEFGSGDVTVLLLPTWSIVHSDFWRHQVPFLARHYRVIVFDGLGNGDSDRPTDARLYGDLLVADDAVAVLDARGVSQAVVVGVSLGGGWALGLCGRYPERVSAAVFIAPEVPLAPQHPAFAAATERFMEVLPTYEGWSRWNRHYWLTEYEDFLRFFFSQCFTEPDSQVQIDHFFRMGLETTPEVLLATDGIEENELTVELATTFAGRIRCPSLVIHGDADAITPLARGEELVRLAGSELIVMPGSGHEPQCRVPDQVNPYIHDFLQASLPGGTT